MKQLLIASVLSFGLASASVLAGTDSTQGDLGQIFAGKVESTQVADLSHQEKQVTEGKIWWWVIPVIPPLSQDLLLGVADLVVGNAPHCESLRAYK